MEFPWSLEFGSWSFVYLERLLHHTGLKVVQWINLNRQVVEFTTLTKGGTDRGPTESWQDRIINPVQSGSRPWTRDKAFRGPHLNDSVLS